MPGLAGQAGPSFNLSVSMCDELSRPCRDTGLPVPGMGRYGKTQSDALARRFSPSSRQSNQSQGLSALTGHGQGIHQRSRAITGRAFTHADAQKVRASTGPRPDIHRSAPARSLEAYFTRTDAQKCTRLHRSSTGRTPVRSRAITGGVFFRCRPQKVRACTVQSGCSAVDPSSEVAMPISFSVPYRYYPVAGWCAGRFSLLLAIYGKDDWREISRFL
jgi:hypothetical protein